MGVLGDIAVADLDDGLDSLTGYRSALHGERPDLAPAASPAQEAEELALALLQWHEDGVAWGDIAVVGRTRRDRAARRPRAARARHPHRRPAATATSRTTPCGPARCTA